MTDSTRWNDRPDYVPTEQMPPGHVQSYRNEYEQEDRTYSTPGTPYATSTPPAPEPGAYRPLAQDYQPSASQQAPAPRTTETHKSDNGIEINTQLFVAGVGATVLVGAVAGFLGGTILRALSERQAFGLDWGTNIQGQWTTAIGGGMFALLAGLLLWVLMSSTPSPVMFFRWAVGLAIVAVGLLPLLISYSTYVEPLCTAVVNVLIGLVVVSLLTKVASEFTDVNK